MKADYYYTETDQGTEIRTPSPCYSVSEAREAFKAMGVYMAIEPQRVNPESEPEYTGEGFENDDPSVYAP